MEIVQKEIRKTNHGMYKCVTIAYDRLTNHIVMILHIPHRIVDVSTRLWT